MSERAPEQPTNETAERRRGRPPGSKNKTTEVQVPEAQAAGATEVNLNAAELAAVEITPEPATPVIDVEEIIGSATHTYLKALYQEKKTGTDLDGAYLKAQDELSAVPNLTQNLATMALLTGLTVRETTDRGETTVAETFTKRHRGFKITMDHLTGNGPAKSGGPSNPSSLGNMTAPKG